MSASTVAASIPTVAQPSVTADPPPDMAQVIVTALNEVLQSPAIQDLEFQVVSGCQASVLNNIYFCNAVEAKGSYSVDDAYDACVATAAGVRSAAYGVCDAARKTCKSACFGIKSCENGCNDISSSCKNAADSVYNSSVSACASLKISGSYDLRLSQVTGLGGVTITSVYDLAASADSANLFSFSADAVVPQTTPNVYYRIQQTPIPPIEGNMAIPVNNTKGKATGTLYRVCSGDPSGRAPGYYIRLDSFSMKLPTNVYDYPSFMSYLKSMGIDVSWFSGAMNQMLAALTGLADGKLSSTIMNELNDLLATMVIAPSDC